MIIAVSWQMSAWQGVEKPGQTKIRYPLPGTMSVQPKRNGPFCLLAIKNTGPGLAVPLPGVVVLVILGINAAV